MTGTTPTAGGITGAPVSRVTLPGIFAAPIFDMDVANNQHEGFPRDDAIRGAAWLGVAIVLFLFIRILLS
jgi:hypothetical protein